LTAVLEVQGLHKTYGAGDLAVHAVRDVSFSTQPGDFVAIVGPSGSGKTTLLAMIGGLLSASAGAIHIDGRDVTRLSDAQRAAYRRDTVGFVFQANNLIPFLTARENLTIMFEIGPGDRSEAARHADRLLEELGLTARAGALATQLSGGERQRVAIARALMRDPLMVLVDEPTANLDTERGRQVVDSLVAEVKQRDKLGIMVTHDPQMAALAKVVLEMRDGHLVSVRRAAAPEG
jgi:putative ABC transport system ATP-binding protein